MPHRFGAAGLVFRSELLAREQHRESARNRQIEIDASAYDSISTVILDHPDPPGPLTDPLNVDAMGTSDDAAYGRPGRQLLRRRYSSARALAPNPGEAAPAYHPRMAGTRCAGRAIRAGRSPIGQRLRTDRERDFAGRLARTIVIPMRIVSLLSRWLVLAALVAAGGSLALLPHATVTAAAQATRVVSASATSEARQSIAMMPLPARLLARCRSAFVLRPVCPRLVPKVPGFLVSGPTGGRSAGFTVFDLQHGAPHEQQPRLNRPPAVLHLTIVAGRSPNSLVGPYPGSKATSTLRNSVETGTRRKPLVFGLRRWGGHTGVLFLAPSYPFGGQIGGHLTFWWRKHGYGYVISLHAWEPLTQAARVLRTIVASAR